VRPEGLRKLKKFNDLIGSRTTTLSRAIIIVIQFNSYLFTCKLNSPEANYRVSTSKKQETTTNCYQKKLKLGSLYSNNHNNNSAKIKIILLYYTFLCIIIIIKVERLIQHLKFPADKVHTTCSFKNLPLAMRLCMYA
jgi:hypothetical protein